KLFAAVPLPVADKLIFPEFVDTVLGSPVTEIPLPEEAPTPVDAAPVKEIAPVPVLVMIAEEEIVIPSLPVPVAGVELKVPFKLIFPSTELIFVPVSETKMPRFVFVPLPAVPTSEILALLVAAIVAAEPMEIPELFVVVPPP